jgi:hypothetical protein
MLDLAFETIPDANPRTHSVADPKQEESFKVVDRRLFTEQGELRKEVVDQERRDEEAAARKAASAAAAAPQKQANGSPTKEDSIETAKDSSQPASETHQPSRNFQMLVDFLTRNAAAMLGGMADPQTGQAFLDLEGAREMIDMIDVLREKTRGNLAKADEDLLMEVAGSLKLTFMEIAKAAAAEQRAKQASGKK